MPNCELAQTTAVGWTQCLDLSSVADAAGTIGTTAVTVALVFAGAVLVIRIIRQAARA